MTRWISSLWRFWTDGSFSGWKRLKLGRGHRGQHCEELKKVKARFLGPFWESPVGFSEEFWATLPRMLDTLRVRDCVSPELILVSVSAVEGSRRSFSELSGLKLRPEAIRGKLMPGREGKRTSLPDRNKDPVQRPGKRTIDPGDISRGKRRKRLCETCHTR